ncbi:MAG: hypothetical protein MUF24_02085 [Chitinophagaceae bacterium]|nr:hypothetical protein [Chitinophagaceae bacterium]
MEITNGRLLTTGKVFWRWFSTATVAPGSSNGLYPFTRPDGLDKWVYISGTAAAGGRLGLYHAAGNLASGELAPRTEAGIDITKGFAGEWQGYTADGFVNNNMALRVISQGTRVSPVANARLLNGEYLLLSSGTHVSSTGTSDRIVIDRVGVTAQTLFEGFRIAAPSENMYNNIKSVKNGKWTESATWDCNCVPTASTSVIIEASHKVTLEANAGNRLAAYTITVNNGATLDINGDTLTAYQVITTPGSELKITGGILQQQFPGYIVHNENAGNYLLTAGQYTLGIPTPDVLPGNHWFSFDFAPTAVFTQSGGMVRSLFPINFSADCKVNITGGGLYLHTHSPNALKPHTVQSSSLKISGSAGISGAKSIAGCTITIPNPMEGVNKLAVNISGQHISFSNSTLLLGDTTLNEDMQTGNAKGFNILSGVKLSHVIAAGGSSINGRHTTYDAGTNPHFGCDNLYITPGSEWRNPDPSNPGFKIFIHGNLVNEGNYTNYLATTVLGGGYKGSVANTPQHLSGSGRFRYLPSAPTAIEPMINFFEVNNLSNAGVTLKRNLKVSQLNMVNGDIMVDTLQVGTADWDWGVINPSGTGAIIGHVTKWIRNIPDQFNIPVGVPGVRRNLKMIVTQAPNPSGLVSFSFAGVPGGATGLPLQEGSINLVTTAPEGYWKVSSLTAGSTWYEVEATAAALGNITDYTQLVLLKRNSGSANWVKEGSHAVPTGNSSLPTLYRSNLFGFGDFAIGSGTVPAIPAQSHWTGNLSREWYNAGNWSQGIPGANTAVMLPGSRPRYPLVTADVTIKSLEAQSGSALHLVAEKNIRLLGNQYP